MSIIILQSLRYISRQDETGSTIPGVNPSAMFEEVPSKREFTGGMQVICCCSAFFNVLGPRFAGFGQPQQLYLGAEIFLGVTQAQLKVLSTAPTFVYTPKLKYFTCPIAAPGAAAPAEDAAFVANLIRRSLPFLITFEWNGVADDQVISALLACERLEHFSFASNVRIDYKISELLRHRNRQVRDGVLDFFRNQLLTGTKNMSRLVNVPTIQNQGGWGGSNPAMSPMNTHPLVYAAERGHTNSVKMLLEFQDELLVMRAEQRANRIVELAEIEAKRIELKTKAETAARERSEKRRLAQMREKTEAKPNPRDWTMAGGGWKGFGLNNNNNNNNFGVNNNNNSNSNDDNSNNWGGNNNTNNNFGINNFGLNNNNNNNAGGWIGGFGNNNNNNTNDDLDSNSADYDKKAPVWNSNGNDFYDDGDVNGGGFGVPSFGFGHGGGDFGGGSVHPVLGSGGFNHNATEMITLLPPPEKLRPIEFIDLDILLLHAAEKGRLSTVTYLLSQGARVSGFSKNDKIAIDLAAEMGDVELVKLLHYAYVDQLADWTSQHGQTIDKIYGGDVRLRMTKAKNINDNVEGDDEAISANQEKYEYLYKQHQENAVLQAQAQGWGTQFPLQPQVLDPTDPTKPERLLRVQPRKPFIGNPLIFGVLYPNVISFLLTEANNFNTTSCSSSSSTTLSRLYDPLQQVQKDPTAPPANAQHYGGGGGWNSHYAQSSVDGSITSIQTAIRYDAVDTVAILLAHCSGVESSKDVLAKVVGDALQLSVSLDMLRQLFLLGNAPQDALEKALLSALRTGTSADVEFLLFEVKVDPNCIDRDSNSKGETALIALIRAAQFDLAKMELLLRAGADCNKYSEPTINVAFDDEKNASDRSSRSRSRSNSSSSSSSSSENNDFASHLQALHANYGYAPAAESEATVFRENAMHARVTPLVALFDFTLVVAQGSPPVAPAWLYSAMKLLLQHGADPNVYLARPVSTSKSVSQRDMIVLQQLGVMQTQMLEQLNMAANLDRKCSFLYEPLLHYLCRYVPSAHHQLSSWNPSPQLPDYSFLELVMSSSKVKLDPNLVVFGCDGTSGEQADELQSSRIGSSCMAAAARCVWKTSLIEKLVVECGGDVLAPLRKLSDQEQEQLQNRFGSEVAWESSTSFLASRAEMIGGMVLVPQPKKNKDKKNKKKKKDNKNKGGNNENDDDDNNSAKEKKGACALIDPATRELLHDAISAGGKLPHSLIFENSGIHVRDQWELHVLNSSPLRIAIAAGNIEGVTVMLKAVGKDALMAAELREVHDMRLAPLMHIAVDASRLVQKRLAQVLQLLREFGANPDLPNPGNGRTLLNLVCSAAALRNPNAHVINAIRTGAQPSQMKFRLEQAEFDDVTLQAAETASLLEKYRASLATAAANPRGSSEPIPFRLLFQGSMALAMNVTKFRDDGSLRTSFLDSDRWNGYGYGWGGNSSHIRQSTFDLKNDRYPQLNDFYDGFTCSNCDKDLLLSRGLRRFCGGCFFVFCSECLNAEKNSRMAVDVADGKEKPIMLCRKCEAIISCESK